MAPKLYMIAGSPACRAVLVTVKALGLSLDIHMVEDLQGPELLKINPQQKVPALIDDGRIICDSHTINAYLVDKYGKDDSLYPKDLYKRAVVHEKLFFDAGEIFSFLHATLVLFMKKEIKSVSSQQAEIPKRWFGVLEKFLEEHQWVAGDSVTIADFSILTTITCLEVLVEIDPISYPKLVEYIKRGLALPSFEGDEVELQAYIQWFKSLLN